MSIITKIYNQIKKLYDKNKKWSFIKSEKNEYVIDKYETTFSINKNKTSELATKIFNEFENKILNSTLYFYNKKCYFEPEWMWGITEDGKLIDFSVPNNGHQWTTWPSHPYPSHFDIKYRWKQEQYDKIIVFDDFYNFSNNYYHFLVKMIAQVFQIQKAGINLSLPVLCPISIREKKFFKEFANLFPILKKLNYIDYQKTIIRCNGFYISDGNTMLPEQINCFKNLQVSPTTPKKKIFIGRKNVARVASNQSEIEKIVREEGFEVIYWENYSVEEQIAIIRNTEYFISFHGAGLTNLLFVQNNNLKVLEIHNANAKLYWHYMLICNLKGINYDCFIGSEMVNDTYQVEAESFKNKLQEWLKK